MLKQYSLKALQLAMNQALSLDADIATRMEPLLDKWLEIIIRPLNERLFMGFTPAGIKLETTIQKEADCRIISSPLGLIRLSLLPASKARSLFNDTIEMHGDVEVGQAVKTLFDSVELDWEGHLAQFTGDIIAHKIGSVWRKSFRMGERLHDSMRSNMEEYLHEELRVSPGPEEVEDFCKDVDALVLDAERAEAKLNRLVKRHESNS